MKIYDQHVHSHFSEDSEQSIEEYLALAENLGLSYVVLTDHLDLNYIGTGYDWVFDIEAQQKELANLAKNHKGITPLRGIEVGYVKSEMDRVKKIMSKHNFDLINFSVHEDGKIDYYLQEQFIELGIPNVLKIYFENELEALNYGFDFDVFCHLDYGFKTAYLIDNSLKIQDYEEYLIKIMKKIISIDKTLELNTSVQGAINIEHTKYLLALYKKLGGKNITVSSDAHEAIEFYGKIDQYIKLIKEAGFDHLNYFIERKRFDCKI